MNIFTKKEKNSSKEKEKQRLLDLKDYIDKQKKLVQNYQEILDNIHSKYNDRIDKIHEQYREKWKDQSSKRLEKYKEIVDEKTSMIEDLRLENAELRDRLRSYKEVYESYRYYRDQVISLIKEMKKSSEKIKLNGAEIDQQFSKLENLADVHLSRMLSVEKRIEEKMSVKELDEGTRLKLIEKQTS